MLKKLNNFHNNLGAIAAFVGEDETKQIINAVENHGPATEALRACLDRWTEMGFSIHEVGLPQTISKLLSKMEG